MQQPLLGIWDREQKTVLFVTPDIDGAVYRGGGRVVLMSAQPGRIKSDRPVAFAHPRHCSLKTTPESGGLKAELTEELRAAMPPRGPDAPRAGRPRFPQLIVAGIPACA